MQRDIIGQNRILSVIDGLTLDTTPRTILLNGLCEGAGEHLVASYLAEHLGLPVDEITEKISDEFIDSIYLKPEPVVYVIDTVKLDVREQNVILKFIEEPLKNAYVVLLCDTTDLILNTVLNRCVVWALETYKEQDLEGFLSDKSKKEVIEIARTPGQVIEFENYDINEMLKRALYIISNIHRASFYNILKLINDVDFKGDAPDKFNLGAWLNVIERQITKLLIGDCGNLSPIRLANALALTIKLNYNSKRVGIDKQSLYYHYLIDLWETMRGD